MFDLPPDADLGSGLGTFLVVMVFALIAHIASRRADNRRGRDAYR